MTDQPDGWVKAQLWEIAETQLGKMLSKKAKVGLHPRPYLRNKNVQWGRIDTGDLLTMDFGADELDRFEVLDGDLLVCEGGEVGRAAIWRGQLAWVGFQKALHRIRPVGGMAPEFLLYCFMWLAESHALDHHVTGSTIKHLPQEDLRQIEIPVPPIGEQRRIVAAIEEQLSRLDDANANLVSASRRLDTLRMAVLRLVLAERWPTKRIKEIATTRSGGTPSRKRVDYFGGSIPWVKSGELRDGHVRATEETLTELGLAESSAKIFQRGTLLIALYGATVGTLGILDIDAATNQAVCAIEPEDPRMVPYLWLVLHAKRAELVAAGQGGAQPNISQGILGELRVPVPPLDVQGRVVGEVELQLQAIASLQAGLEQIRCRSAMLRRVVLDRAFRGELVPQDPADEPASVLLDWTRLEREAAPVKTRHRRVRA